MSGEEETESTIHYIPFEERITSKASNLYRGEEDWWRTRFTLSRWSMGRLIFGSLIFVCLALWEPTIYSIMFLGFWLFSSMSYLLGILIWQFKQRRRSVLFSALLTLSLGYMMWFSSWFLYRPVVTLGDMILNVVFATMLIPFFAIDAYSLLRAYKNEAKNGLESPSVRAE